MDYLTTFYIGCEDNGEVASPGIHGTTYLTQHNTQGHMELMNICLLYTSPSPRDGLLSRMPSSA